MTCDVVVIGAGFAGFAAAVRLADRGLDVVVADEAPRLGGRATAFSDRETGERVDNGQHVLFGCYRETYRFLNRIGTAHLAPLESRLRLRMADGDGRSFELSCPDIRPPWGLAAGILRWRALSFGDRLSALKIRPLLDSVRRDGPAAAAARVPSGQTVTEWLAAQGQSPRLCAWLWRPLAFAALNQSPDIAAAAPFVRVVGELFGSSPADSSIGLPVAPLDELYAEPARRLVETRGGRVLVKSAVRMAAADGRITSIHAGGEPVQAAAVICAVPWRRLARVWDDRPPPELEAIVSNATAMKSSPIVTVNLWFDGPVTSDRFVGLTEGPMHWVFDKGAIFGERAAHLSVVASGADALVQLDNAAITGEAMLRLGRALPQIRARTLVRSVVVREPHASFSLAPGGPPRPPAVTPLAGFYLAGDWTDTGLPGTIEGAVQSGHRAAAELLARSGVRIDS